MKIYSRFALNFQIKNREVIVKMKIHVEIKKKREKESYSSAESNEIFQKWQEPSD